MKAANRENKEPTKREVAELSEASPVLPTPFPEEEEVSKKIC